LKTTSHIAAVAFSFIASLAHADPPESMAAITARGPDSSIVGLTGMFGKQGLIYSDDSGETFGALCKAFAAIPSVDSTGRPTTKRPSFKNTIVTHDGHFLVGDFNGLWIDDGHGCNWQLAPELDKVYVSALRFDPRDPKIIYGLSATTAQPDNGLFKIDAEGKIEHLGEKAPMPFYGLGVVALPNGGTRFYAMGVREQAQFMTDDDGGVTLLEPSDAGFPVDDAGFPLPNVGTSPFYVIRHSDDFGASWIDHDIGVAPNLSTDFDAVDPSNPDRVVISRRNDNAFRGSTAIPDQLLVSEDRGKTFRQWFTVSSLVGVSIMRDGTVFIADRGEGKAGDPRGLWRADSVLDEPELIADYETWCLEAREDRLEVCQRFDWGTADPVTGEFTKLASFLELQRVHSCAGIDSVGMCREELCNGHCLHWADAPACAEHYPECAMENFFSRPDSGTSDAGPTADAGSLRDAGTPLATNSDGCSCGVIGSGSGGARHAGLLSAALAALLVARRRRSARSAREAA
jgi:hypothetical protein